MTVADRWSLPIVLLAAAALAGCGQEPPKTPPAAKAEAHDHTAPHGGELLELGEEEAHVEVLHDRKAATVTVWVYGKTLAAPAAVEAPKLLLAGKELAGVALDPKPGATTATSWKFTDPALDADPLEGRIVVTVDGKTHRSPLEPAGHAHK